MAYDRELAERIRGVLIDSSDVSETAMFGGLAFLIGGHLAIAASGQGGALVRVERTVADELVRTTGAQPAVMRGRPMAGWLRVADEDLRADDALAGWVHRAVDHARTLPPKRAARRRR